MTSIADHPSTSAEDIRIGIIGLDTSHVIHFTRQLNDSDDPQQVRGGKVVAAFKGGSPDIAEVRNKAESE